MMGNSEQFFVSRGVFHKKSIQPDVSAFYVVHKTSYLKENE